MLPPLRWLALVLLCFVPSLPAADKLPKESVTFDGHTLYLASEEKNSSVHLREYLTKGETFEHWTRLAGIFEYPRDNDVKAVVSRLIDGLKKANPDAKSAVIENPTTGELIVDFVTWPPGVAFVEFNVFLYGKNPAGGLIAKQYAVREYKDTTAFLKKLKDERTRLVELMAAGNFKVSK